MSFKDIEIVDCFRDAIQGLHQPIATQKKIDYVNLLLASGRFSCLDIGSFVSPKAVLQMADTANVLAGIVKSGSTKLSVVVANERGAEAALAQEKVDFLGYPFSISETFQKRNTNADLKESFERVQRMQNRVAASDKELIVYISMAFGNPYDDAWDKQMVVYWLDQLKSIGVTRFSLADTTGEATPDSITAVLQEVAAYDPSLNPSLHLHSRLDSALSKIDAAYRAGCRKFEGAILGYGGCPFAQDSLVGNIPTELLLLHFEHSSTEELQPIITAFKDLIAD